MCVNVHEKGCRTCGFTSRLFSGVGTGQASLASLFTFVSAQSMWWQTAAMLCMVMYALHGLCVIDLSSLEHQKTGVTQLGNHHCFKLRVTAHMLNAETMPWWFSIGHTEPDMGQLTKRLCFDQHSCRCRNLQSHQNLLEPWHGIFWQMRLSYKMGVRCMWHHTCKQMIGWACSITTLPVSNTFQIILI